MVSQRRQPGFTLLEVILAMAMVSMLSLSLYASLRIAFKARDSANEAVAPIRSIQVTMDLIRQDIENALPPTGTLAGPFIGQPDNSAGVSSCTLELYTIAHSTPSGSIDPIEAGGIRKIDLGIVASPDGSGASANMVLVRRITKNLLAQMDEEPEEEIICRNVRTFSLRYFDGDYWQDTWDSTVQDNALPSAIEVSLELEIPSPKNQAPSICRMVRIFPLPCHKDLDSIAGGGAS